MSISGAVLHVLYVFSGGIDESLLLRKYDDDVSVYEFMTILTAPLVIHTGTPEATRAGLKYLGYSFFGAGLGLMGFFFLNTYCRTTIFMPGGTLDMAMVAGHETCFWLCSS